MRQKVFTLHVRWLTSTIFTLFCATQVAASCAGEDGGVGVVTTITSGDTLILEDGRAVRLTGILGPKPGRDGPTAEARRRMETALAEIVLGKKVSLQLDERKRDRYGRILAQVLLVSQGESLWVQAALIRDGLARVMSFRDNRLCIRDLLKLEEEARRDSRGHWATGFFAIRAAEAEDALSRLEQSYEIVEGIVSSVAEIKGKTYINFGHNWRRDFTGFISAKDAEFVAGEPKAQESPSAFASLNGRRVRIRGWLKNFNGPSISLTHPEQIEILDNATAFVR